MFPYQYLYAYHLFIIVLTAVWTFRRLISGQIKRRFFSQNVPRLLFIASHYVFHRGVKRPERDVDHSILFWVWEWVELCLHSPLYFFLAQTGTVWFYYIILLKWHLCIWRSWIRASWYNYENNQQDALYRLIYYSKSALHVSGVVFAHHQEHLTVFTVSGSVHPSCCRLYSASCWLFS